jgi:hypothetical protein
VRVVLVDSFVERSNSLHVQNLECNKNVEDLVGIAREVAFGLMGLNSSLFQTMLTCKFVA